MEKTQEQPLGSKLNLVTGYIAFGSVDEARTICRKLINDKLIACANILPEHEAIYSWENQIKSSKEVSAIIKTSQHAINAINQLLQETHSYECPCFIHWGIDGGNNHFLDWITQQTKESL